MGDACQRSLDEGHQRSNCWDGLRIGLTAVPSRIGLSLEVATEVYIGA